MNVFAASPGLVGLQGADHSRGTAHGQSREAEFPTSYRIFANDALGQNPVISYTFAIRALLLAQMGFGLGVVVYGFYRW